MKEFKVGERVVLKITETEEETCYGCFFFGNSACEVWKNTHAVLNYVRIIRM